jgi:type IV pilus assembly protein PilW
MTAYHRPMTDTPVRAPRASCARRQRGLSLIELMVGLALGLAVTAALLLLFANASANGQNLARSGVQIENGRYVSELLREDLRLAGFYGETPVRGALYSTPDPCSTVPTGWAGVPYTLPVGVQGYGPGEALGCLNYRKDGTQAIAVRRLGVERVDPAALAPTNTQYLVQYSFCSEDISNPRLVFSADPSQMTLRNRACTASNTVRPYVSRIYYVASCNRCPSGDTTPTLKRVDLVGDELVTTALAEGIDDLRLEYGFDLDNNGSADTYLTGLGGSGGSTAWENVMSIKLHFITRSLDKATGSALATAQQFELGGIGTVSVAYDGYTRRAYSSVVRLVNPSGAREMQ